MTFSSRWQAHLAQALPILALGMWGAPWAHAASQLTANTAVVTARGQDILRDARTVTDVVGRQRLDASVDHAVAAPEGSADVGRIQGQATADLDTQLGGMKLLTSVQSAVPSGERLRGESFASAALTDTLRLTGAGSQPARLRLQVGYDATHDLSSVTSADVASYLIRKESTAEFTVRVSWQVPNPQHGTSEEESPTLTETRTLTGHMWTLWDGRTHWYSSALTERDLHGDLSSTERAIYFDEPPAGSLPADARWQGSHAFDVWVPGDTDLQFEWLTSVHAACADTRACSAQVDAMHSFNLGLQPSVGQVTSANGYAFLQQAAPVPEPEAIWMAALGLCALGGHRRVRQAIRRAV